MIATYYGAGIGWTLIIIALVYAAIAPIWLRDRRRRRTDRTTRKDP